jgi:beta-galactosidase
VNKENAVIKVKTSAGKPATVQIRILDSTGNVITKKENLNNDTSTQQLIINTPTLWSSVQPFLYKAEISILRAGKVTDRAIILIGIRNVRIDAKTVLSINGQRIRLKGAYITTMDSWVPQQQQEMTAPTDPPVFNNRPVLPLKVKRLL